MVPDAAPRLWARRRAVPGVRHADPEDHRGPARNPLLPAVPTTVAATSARAFAISSATSITAFIDFTSCTRTKCAPKKTAAATAAAEANSVSDGDSLARKGLREGPARIGKRSEE